MLAAAAAVLSGGLALPPDGLPLTPRSGAIVRTYIAEPAEPIPSRSYQPYRPSRGRAEVTRRPRTFRSAPDSSSPPSFAAEPDPTPTARRSLTAAPESPRLNPARRDVIAYALAQVGDPYVYGATGPDSYDCSGLVLRAFAHAGYAMPRVSGAQHGMGTSTSVSSLDPGDLVAWSGHVAIWLGDGRLVEAARPGTVVRVRRFDPTGSWFDATAWGVSLDYSRLPRL